MTAASSGDSPTVGDELSVRAGERELAAYVREEAPAFESPRPYWHPVRTPAGVVVSEVRPPDHSWHWGLSIAVANIDVTALGEEVNTWGGVTWVRGQGYQQLANNGRQHHEGWERTADGHPAQRLTWRTPADEPFLTERRAVTAADVDGGWQLAVTSHWQNLTSGDLRFGSPTTAGRPDAGYGGFFLRGHPRLLGAQVTLDEVALGAEEAMGRTGSTLALTGGSVAVAMTAAADNPVTPTPWFVRTDPVVMLCAAPFFHEEWVLAAGATATWSWQLAVAGEPPA